MPTFIEVKKYNRPFMVSCRRYFLLIAYQPPNNETMQDAKHPIHTKKHQNTIGFESNRSSIGISYHLKVLLYMQKETREISQISFILQQHFIGCCWFFVWGNACPWRGAAWINCCRARLALWSFLHYFLHCNDPRAPVCGPGACCPKDALKKLPTRRIDALIFRKPSRWCG